MSKINLILFISLILLTARADTPPTVLSVNGSIGRVVLTTTNITEGTNLYFTNPRVYSALGTSYLKADGSIPLTANWSLGSFKLTNLLDPTNPQDAATKAYVDAHAGAISWGTITGTLSNQTDLQSALNGKEPTITSGTTLQYWRGDKSFQTLDTSVVPENGNLYFTNARAQGAVSASAPLVDTAGVFSIPMATSLVSGYLLNTDWSIFNNKQSALTFGNLTDAGTDGITVTNGSGAVIGTGTSISQHVADSSHNGYLSDSDWTTFNNKLSKVEGNYITNPDAEIDTSGWNLYNDSGRTVPASVTNQDITYTSALSGGGGNGATISYTFCGSSYVGPIVTCPSGTAVQVCWYNGPTLADNPTATVLKAAYDAQSCATAIATSAITGTAGNLQYENGTTTLANGGDTSPVDGTGGVVSGVTFTRNTSTPLVGIASFDLGKDAANREGQGVSTDFIINSVDKNSTLQISFIYEGSSGMTMGSASDPRVFVYDIDNAVLIPVVPLNTLAGPVSTAKTFVGTFPTTSSSNYRLIIHIATASTTAWDLLLDSVTINNEVTPTVATQVPSVVLLAQSISGAVTDHMVVMWKDGATQWVPATIAGAALPTFGDDQTQLGFATNIVGSEASIYIRGAMGGFSFGPFTGYQQYIDNTAGLISPLPSPFNDMYVIVGTAVGSTVLNIEFVRHVDQIQNGSGVPVKGGLLTAGSANDGTGDVVLSPGTNGTFLVANSAVTKGLNWRTIASGDVPTLNQNTTGSAATLTTARTIAGTSFNGSANISLANKFIVQGTSDAGLSSPQFLGALSTGIIKNTTTTGVLSIAAASDFANLTPMTTLGDLIYENATPTATRLAGNITATKNFLTQTGNGSISAAPVWGSVASGDVSNASGVTGSTITNALNTLNNSVNEVLVNATKNGGSVTANTEIASWTTVNQDTNTNFNGTTGTFTASVAGDYTVTFIAAATGVGTPTAQVYHNGSLFQTGIGPLTRTIVSTYIPNVAVNDTIWVAVDSSVTLTSTTTDNILTISKVSGASVPIVQARYHAATGTITSSLSNISFSTKDYDSASAYSAPTYTIPASTGAGVYHYDACVYLTATTTAANQVATCAVLDNGTIISESTQFLSSTTTKPIQCCVRDTYKFANSDAVTVQASLNGTTNSISASNVFNYFSIYKVSN